MCSRLVVDHRSQLKYSTSNRLLSFAVTVYALLSKRYLEFKFKMTIICNMRKRNFHRLKRSDSPFARLLTFFRLDYNYTAFCVKTCVYTPINFNWCKEQWFQQDGVTCLPGVCEIFPQKSISRRVVINWPSLRPDLIPVDFFLMGISYIKGMQQQSRFFD